MRMFGDLFEHRKQRLFRLVRHTNACISYLDVEIVLFFRDELSLNLNCTALAGELYRIHNKILHDRPYPLIIEYKHRIGDLFANISINLDVLALSLERNNVEQIRKRVIQIHRHRFELEFSILNKI